MYILQIFKNETNNCVGYVYNVYIKKKKFNTAKQHSDTDIIFIKRYKQYSKDMVKDKTSLRL